MRNPHLSIGAFLWVFLAAKSLAQCEPGWISTGLVAGFDDEVLALTHWDPDGASGPEPEWMIFGGRFRVAGDRLESAIVGWDGVRFRRIGAGRFDGYVAVLAVHNGELIAAGGASIPTGEFEKGVFRWTGAEWQRIGTLPDNDEPKAMTTHDGELIVASELGLRRWDGQTWRYFGPQLWGHFYAVASYGGELYAGGRSIVAAPLWEYRNIVRWTGESWLPASHLDGRVEALQVHNGALYAGGSFYGNAHGTALHGFGRWDGEEWQAVNGAPGNVVCMNSRGENLLVANLIGDVAHWDGSSWAVLPRAFADVLSVAEFQGTIVAAGPFADESISVMWAAIWNGNEWLPVVDGSGWQIRTPPRIRALANYGNDLVAAGPVSRWGGVPARRIARFDGQTWHPLGAGVAPAGWVFALREHAGALYAGGDIRTIGGVATGSLARWDGSGWSRVGLGIDRDWVLALCEFDGKLFLGGTFHEAGGIVAERLASWNGTAFEAVGGGLNGLVTALTTYSDELIVAGEFTMAGTTAANRIAVWDGQAWSPLGGGLESQSKALTEFQGELIAGGFFRLAGDKPVNRIAAWNGSTWRNLGGGVDRPSGSAGVSALVVADESLFVGGSFSQAGEIAASNAARWDGGAWHALAAGTNDSIVDIVRFRGKLAIAGNLTIADGRPSAFWALYGPRLIADLDRDEDVDLADLATLLASFGTSDVSPSQGDLDVDNDVDLADLSQFLTEFGRNCD